MTEICERIGRPPRRRGADGRWERADGGEWDWFYALPQDEQRYIRVHHMVADGLEPDNAAMRRHDGDVDAWADEWLRAIRTVRRTRCELDEWADRTVDEWGEEPEPDEGDIVERALAHVVAGASLSAYEADALVRAVRSAQGQRVPEIDAGASGNGVGRLPSLIGPAEVAKLMGVKTDTIRQWRARGKMPPPTEVLSGRPAWGRSVIAGWLEDCKLAG